MPRYIVLVNWTDQGIRNVKETTKRADAANSMAKKLGGTKFEIYYTMGESDLVALAEMPNDEAALQFDLWLGSLGNVRTRTMKAWTPEEFAKVVSKLQ